MNYPIPRARAARYKEVMKRKITKWKHERIVQISAVLPVAVELIVGTDDDDPGEDSDWKILSVRSANCEASPRMVEENMGEDESAELSRAAARAEDTK